VKSWTAIWFILYLVLFCKSRIHTDRVVYYLWVSVCFYSAWYFASWLFVSSENCHCKNSGWTYTRFPFHNYLSCSSATNFASTCQNVRLESTSLLVWQVSQSNASIGNPWDQMPPFCKFASCLSSREVRHFLQYVNARDYWDTSNILHQVWSGGRRTVTWLHDHQNCLAFIFFFSRSTVHCSAGLRPAKEPAINVHSPCAHINSAPRSE